MNIRSTCRKNFGPVRAVFGAAALAGMLLTASPLQAQGIPTIPVAPLEPPVAYRPLPPEVQDDKSEAIKEELDIPGTDSDRWFPTVVFQAARVNYNEALYRKAVESVGMTVGLNYLEKFGITLGYNFNTVNFYEGISALDQESWSASIFQNLTPDSLDGNLTLRLDGHLIRNNDTTHLSDEGWAVMPIINYAPRDKNYFFELGYAYSRYYGDFELHQITPAAGYGFNEGSDWVTLRGFYINPNKPWRAGNLPRTYSAAGNWTHWFAPNYTPFMPSHVKLGGQVGQRTFAVDPDAMSVSNLADVDLGNVSLGIGWKMGENADLNLHAGRAWYQDRNIYLGSWDKYTADVGYMNMVLHW